LNLQLALDRMNKEECKSVLAETHASVDWIEVGTGVIKQYGVQIIRELREDWPDKVIVADMKTCDAGKDEAAQAFNAGADITTVMAFASDKTIAAALEEAEKHGKKVMVDLLGCDLSSRLKELNYLGVDLVSLHIGKDEQEDGGLRNENFRPFDDFPHIKIAAAGGLTVNNFPEALHKYAHTVIVGSFITRAEHPGLAAREMRDAMRSQL
jgi:3-hexulose-6-phosphate synthase